MTDKMLRKTKTESDEESKTETDRIFRKTETKSDEEIKTKIDKIYTKKKQRQKAMKNVKQRQTEY